MDRNSEHQAFPTASSGGVRAGVGVLAAKEQQEELHVWRWQLLYLGEPEVPPVTLFMTTLYPLGRASPLENPKWANIDNPHQIGPAMCARFSQRCWSPQLWDSLCWESPLQGTFRWTGVSGAGWCRVRAQLWVSQHPDASLSKTGELEGEWEPLCSRMTISFLMS